MTPRTVIVPMAFVAGVDFGTLRARVTLVDTSRGRLASGIAEYALHRKKEDPDYATQSHDDHVRALAEAMRALAAPCAPGEQVAALAMDTTGSSAIPVGEKLQPLSEYYLWCDHRSWREAALIAKTARERKLEVIDWCGGTCSSEWGFAKLLHWLRHNPAKRSQFLTAFEPSDMIAAVLCGITAPGSVPRSICALGHKWMWNRALGGLPPEDFLGAVDPLLSGIRAQLTGRYETSDKVAGALTPEWAARLGLRSDMPIPVGAFDAHCDAIGAGACTGDVGNVVGTSTCIIAMSEDTRLIPGVCGVVPASVHPNKTEVEAGLFVTLGWNLSHSAQDELFAAIEGTAFHTRVIFLERMEQHSVPIRRVINAGGIPQKNEVLNRIYANVLSKPVLIPQSEVTSLGSAIFASLAAGLFRRSKRPRMRCARSTVWSSPTPRPPESTKSFMGCIGSCILVWA